DDAWTIGWTPPGDGSFALFALAEDWAGNVQSIAIPSVVQVASATPTIDIAPTVITSTLQLGPQTVALGGSGSAGGGLVEVQTAPGGPFTPAAYDGAAWQFSWGLGGTPDGASY